MANYFSSDWHIGEESIIEWERTQFYSIEEHNLAIFKFVQNLVEKIKPGDNFYMLGDYGDTDRLWYIEELTRAGAHTIFIAGNHDKLADKEKFEKYFDEVYWHPIYLSERIIVSHFPQAVWEGQISVHGHVHNGYIANSAYINCNIHYNNYKPITDKHINTAFGKVGKLQTRFLSEPWINIQKSTIPRDDIILNPDMSIDISATKAWWKMQNKTSVRN